MSEQGLLNSTAALCGKCMKPLPANGDFVVCYHCNTNYHYAPCTSLGESTYARMAKDRKTEWRCANCRPKQRSASASGGCEAHQGQKPNRDGEQEEESCNKNKRFRSDERLSAQEGTNDIRADIKDIKKILQTMDTRMNAMENIDIQEKIGKTFATINSMVEKLMEQVTSLTEQNTQKDSKIAALENKINNLEQQSLDNNIEISNVPMHEGENIMNVVKNLAQSINVQITDNDIEDAYRQRKKNNIILKLSTRWKKREIMAKGKKHNINTAENRIYFNDQLTPFNKKLLWMTKNAAKSSNWKFVWVRVGKILAKKDENSETFLIKQEQDISIIS